METADSTSTVERTHPVADQIKAQTERLNVLVGFVVQYGPTCNERDGIDLSGDGGDIKAARELAVVSAFEAIRRIADAS